MIKKVKSINSDDENNIDHIQGRRKIDSSERKNFSKRAEKGLLTTVKERCPSCNHNKLFIGNLGGHNIKKCCKCKHEVKS